MEETVFDKIISGEISADIVYRNDHVIAFRDINPQAPVHVLVLPLTRIRNLTELRDQDAEVLGKFLQGIAETARELDLEENGYRVVFNNGRDAQQTVHYVHAHILGGRKMKWPPG
jgi:histidine triad (HIT) family protein